MTEMNLLTPAGLVAIAALITAIVALKKIVRPSDEADQPITMSGGSLLNDSARWRMRGNKGTYSATKPLKAVWFTCTSSATEQEYSFTDPFRISIKYTDPDSATDYLLIHLDYKQGKMLAEQVDQAGNPVAASLNSFLNHGHHPKPWVTTSITSSGGISLPACGAEVKNFYLNFVFE